MAFPVLKILSILAVFLFSCGIQVDCKVDKYVLNVVENGTSVNEEVEVDEDEQTEVIRVPKHNNVDALEIMNDFNAGLSARRAPANKACYVSKLGSSFPPPEKMKIDMDQASRQSLPNEVTTERLEWKILGFADRSALPQKILKFCGSFPVYEIEEREIPLEILNVSRRENSAWVRSKRDHIFNIEYQLCSEYDHGKLENCLKKVGLPTKLKYDCRSERIVCYYIAKCTHQGNNPYNGAFQCTKVSHYTVEFGGCCTITC